MDRIKSLFFSGLYTILTMLPLGARGETFADLQKPHNDVNLTCDADNATDAVSVAEYKAACKANGPTGIWCCMPYIGVRRCVVEGWYLNEETLLCEKAPMANISGDGGWYTEHYGSCKPVAYVIKGENTETTDCCTVVVPSIYDVQKLSPTHWCRYECAGITIPGTTDGIFEYSPDGEKI